MLWIALGPRWGSHCCEVGIMNQTSLFPNPRILTLIVKCGSLTTERLRASKAWHSLSSTRFFFWILLSEGWCWAKSLPRLETRHPAVLFWTKQLCTGCTRHSILQLKIINIVSITPCTLITTHSLSRSCRHGCDKNITATKTSLLLPVGILNTTEP